MITIFHVRLIGHLGLFTKAEFKYTIQIIWQYDSKIDNILKQLVSLLPQTQNAGTSLAVI